MDLSLSVYCFVETEIIMTLFQSIKGDVPVELAERVALRLHIHFFNFY